MGEVESLKKVRTVFSEAVMRIGSSPSLVLLVQLVDAVLSLVRGKLGQDDAWGQHAFSDNFRSALNWIDEVIDVTVKREVQGEVGCPSESFDVG